MKFTGDTQMEEQLKRIAPSFFVLTIVGLGTFSGLYTFSGLGLLIDNTVLAIILACVIQLTIASTVIGLPFVNGPLKIFLLIFYFIFLMISSATAYVYIFNEQAASRGVIDGQMPLIQKVSSYLTELKTNEAARLQERKAAIEKAQAELDEEENLGRQSGRGPGKGDRYSDKFLLLEERKSELARVEEQYGIFSDKYDYLVNMVSRDLGEEDLKRLPFLIDELTGLADSENPEKLADIRGYLGDARTPVERALEPIINKEWGSINVLSSIIWSALFDTASLLMGLLWLHIQRKRRGILVVIYESLKEMLIGFRRILNLRKELNDSALGNQPDLGSEQRQKLQRFGARIVATCNALSDGGDSIDPLDPIKMVVRHLRVLNFSDIPRQKDSTEPAIGIFASAVDEDPQLQAILAVMVLGEVFLVNGQRGAYELNRENELAYDMLIYFLNNPPYVASHEVRGYFPKWSAQNLLPVYEESEENIS